MNAEHLRVFTHNAGLYLPNEVKLVVRQLSAAGFCIILVDFILDKPFLLLNRVRLPTLPCFRLTQYPYDWFSFPRAPFSFYQSFVRFCPAWLNLTYPKGSCIFETITLPKEKGSSSHFLVSSVLHTSLEEFVKDICVARLKKATKKF